MGLRQAFAASLTAADVMMMMKRLAIRPPFCLSGVLGVILIAVTVLLQMAATNFQSSSFARLRASFRPSESCQQTEGTAGQ